MGQKLFWIILFIFSLLFTGQRAGAQQSQDLLKELDEKPPAEQGKKPAEETAGKTAKAWDPLGQLQKNFEGSLRLRYTGYFNPAEERPDADTKRHQGEVLLKFADWVGDKKLRLDISGWLEAGTQKNTYAGVTDSWQETDDRRNYLEINELFLTHQQKDFTAYLGKRLFPNGIATLYSPADILRPRDMNDPLDWKYFGIWQGRRGLFLEGEQPDGGLPARLPALENAQPDFPLGRKPHQQGLSTGSLLHGTLPERPG